MRSNESPKETMIASTHRRPAAAQASRPGAGRPPAPFVLGQNLRGVRRSVATTPGLLRLSLGTIWSLSAVTLLAAYIGIDRHRHEMQAIGKDSAPSIIAAQEIRASLADMQLNVARELLDSGNVSRAAADAYERHRKSAATSLVSAAENITYGDAERVPIRTLVFGAGTFEQDVARAKALHERHDPAYLPQLRDAERVIHEDLLPAADALDKANLDAMDKAYSSERFYSKLGTAFFIVAAVVLLAGLIATQELLFRKMRRIFNLPLIGASVALVWFLASLVSGFLAESHELKVVKEDCFDSIHALSRARAYAYDARGYQLLGLLDPQRGDLMGGGFAANSMKIINLDPGETLETIVLNGNGSGFTGCLADELHNITFGGEEEAAADALRAYAEYLSGSAVSARLNAAGDPRGTQIALSDLPDVSPAASINAGPSKLQGCGYAFNRFDLALGRTLAINQREFDAALQRGMAALEGRLGGSSVMMALIAILTYVGLRPRLTEYAA
jgi:hypothetical protein